MPHPLQPVLRRTTLFSNLDDVELEAIANLCRQRSVPKGSILFYEDDPGTSCYILTDGGVKIVVNSQDGREHILGLLRPSSPGIPEPPTWLRPCPSRRSWPGYPSCRATTGRTSWP